MFVFTFSLYVMQCARCMPRGANFNMRFNFTLPRIRYECGILYEIQNPCMSLYVWDTWEINTWHNSFNFKIGFKIKLKQNLFKNQTLLKILSFNAINKTPCWNLVHRGAVIAYATRICHDLEETRVNGRFNATPRWNLGLLNAVIAYATRV